MLAMILLTLNMWSKLFMCYMIYSDKYNHYTLILNSSWELIVYIISVLSIFRAPSLHKRTS